MERLAFIREAQLVGLTLTEIASVLDMKDIGTGACEHTASLLLRHLEVLDPIDCRDPHRFQVIATRH